MLLSGQTVPNPSSALEAANQAATQAAITLDLAYDGGTAITADSGAVAITNSVADGTNALEITKSPAAAQNGSALTITQNANATDAALSITLNSVGTSTTRVGVALIPDDTDVSVAADVHSPKFTFLCQSQFSELPLPPADQAVLFTWGIQAKGLSGGDGSELVFAVGASSVLELKSDLGAVFYGGVLPDTTGANDLGSTAARWEAAYFDTGGFNSSGVQFSNASLYAAASGDLRIVCSALNVMKFSGTTTEVENKLLCAPDTASPVTAMQVNQVAFTSVDNAVPAVLFAFDAAAMTFDWNGAGGGLASQYALQINQPTYAADIAGFDIADSATVYIEGPPLNGGNVVYTNGPYALFVDAGITKLDDNVVITNALADSTNSLEIKKTPAASQDGSAIDIEHTNSSGTDASIHIVSDATFGLRLQHPNYGVSPVDSPIIELRSTAAGVVDKRGTIRQVAADLNLGGGAITDCFKITPENAQKSLAPRGFRAQRNDADELVFDCVGNSLNLAASEIAKMCAEIGGGSLAWADADAVATAHWTTFKPPAFTSSVGTKTITDSSTVYISGPPDDTDANVTVTNSYALFVGGGISRFDGGGGFVFELPADATSVGSSAGRIPVKIGGATKYLAYYDA